MNERLVYRLKGIPSDGFVGSYGLNMYVECNVTTLSACREHGWFCWHKERALSHTSEHT